VWRRDQRKRSVDTRATEQHPDGSAGRELLCGFGIDTGYQHARDARDDRTAGRANAVLGRVGRRRGF
jgi:hypothetical protein